MSEDKRPKPEPESEWERLREASLDALGEQHQAMTDEERDAALRAAGEDPEAVRRDAEAFAARMRAKIEGRLADAEGRATAQPPLAEVVALPARRKSPFLLWLVAAAVAGAAISTGVTIAIRDRPPRPPPRGESPQEMVAGEARSVQIAGFVEQAEGARKTNDYLGCIQLLDHADALRSKPAPQDDELRKRCIGEGVAYYRALGLTKKKEESWEACAASFLAADTLEGRAKESDPDWVDCAHHPEKPKKGPH